MGSFPKNSKGGTSTANLLLLDSEAFKELEIKKVDSTLRSIKNNFWLERLFRAINRFIKVTWILISNKPDSALIFCGHGLGFIEKGFYVFYLNLFGIPSVIAPRSGIILKNLKSDLFKWYTRKVFNVTKYIICQGNYWVRIYSNYSDTNKLVSIHNWVPVPEKFIECDKKNTDSPFILSYLGWLENYKGISTVLETIPELVKRGFDFEFHMYGEGTIKNDILRYIKEKNLSEYVFVHDWVSDSEKSEVYLNSSALVFASKSEGMPNVVLEAMSYGLPVIANGITSIPEVIKHKENGLLYFRNDKNAMVSNIYSLMNNKKLCLKLSRNARKTIELNHQIEAAAAKIVGLLYGPN